HAVATLLANPPRREVLARAASVIAHRDFGWGPLGAKQRDLWRRIAPSPLHIRTLVTADHAEVDAIQQVSPESAAWDLASYPPATTWVAAVDGTIAGFLAARSLTAGEFEILNLAVAPTWRRQGIAARLLEHIARASPGQWFLEVRESNTPARLLYAKLGFHPVGRRPRYYKDPIEDALILKRC
ncbi:MAG: GNAT family N-acetyltransferase, partial [Acidobacteriota bacterium]